jgi:hypothetical protein
MFHSRSCTEAQNYRLKKTRQFIYDFIIQEIQDNIDQLQELPTPQYYGRVTKPMAYMLLAKMYINAQEWIGEDHFADAVAACDAIIALNAYGIRSDYFSNFSIDNDIPVEGEPTETYLLSHIIHSLPMSTSTGHTSR